LINLKFYSTVWVVNIDVPISQMLRLSRNPMSGKPGMPTRRGFVAATAIAAASHASIKSAQAVPKSPERADFLFVQSAKGMTFDMATNKLALTGVSPVTVFFSDRPERIAGT
jgi:hypothetical protein